MNAFLRFFLTACAFAIAGCYPVERFWWSPDGSRAVVLAGEKPQLHLVKAAGELGMPVANAQIDDDFPAAVAWLPDGSGFVLHRVLPRGTWEEARVLLPPAEVAEIERHARGMPDLFQAAAAMGGEQDAVDSMLNGFMRDKQLLAAAFYCAREKQPAAIEAAVLATPRGAEVLANAKKEATPFAVHEICLIRVTGDHEAAEPQPITRSFRPLVLPKACPKFPAVAYWRAAEDEEFVVLEVATLDGKSRTQAGQSSGATFDWTPDGRAIVHTTPVSDRDNSLQTIRRVTVLNESGALVESDRETVDLAVAIMPTPLRLSVLPDGRVLFASQPAKLPAPRGSLDLEPRLFLISADGKSVIEVPTAPGDLPANLGFFAASPDGQRVAVVESDTIAVAVVDLATGKTEIVSPAQAGWGCRTLPAWKSATELTFAALPPGKESPQWMLWKKGEGLRSLSERWPADATGPWLTQKKDPQGAAKERP
jgi:hypothetical protein